MITGRRPRPFVVRRGGAAYVAVNKYRCDLGPVRTATALQIDSLTVSLAAFPREIAWCGHGDPGSVLDLPRSSRRLPRRAGRKAYPGGQRRSNGTSRHTWPRRPAPMSTNLKTNLDARPKLQWKSQPTRSGRDV
jgi:hypothetical protein